jgi:murein DD-endopeptidase MepM/ murein hydrolase activator NlpD
MHSVKLWCYAGIDVHLSSKLPHWGNLLFATLALPALLVPPLPATAVVKSSWVLAASPAHVVNGSPLLIRVKPPQPVDELTGKWLGHDLALTYDPATRAWYSLMGVSLETKPGSYLLQVKGNTRTGQEISFERRIAIGKAKHKRISVSVSKKFTEPSAEQLKTIAEDKQVKESLFNRITLQREWSGDFRAPVQAQISDVFGTERVFNGKVQSYHQGLDYGVPSGTSVSALNSGTVLLARNLYFEGNCVMIDHGQGLLTLYLHLSEFAVKEGQRVKRGEVIGLSGGTGRATGPHLHVAVRWQGIYLDPATLMTLKLPASPTP